MLLKKHGWDAIYKDIILSMFVFLNGFFVLFDGGGTQMGTFGGLLGGSAGGNEQQVDE